MRSLRGGEAERLRTSLGLGTTQLRQFLFRSREFEQMEIEYFIDPEEPRLRAPSFWAAETQKPVQISGRLPADPGRMDPGDVELPEGQGTRAARGPSRSPVSGLSLSLFQAVGLKESLMDREVARDVRRRAPVRRVTAREVHEGAKLAHYARACTDIVFRCRSQLKSLSVCSA